MKKLIGRPACVVMLALAFAACTHHRSADLTKPNTQDNFGVQMAQMNLWREAMFRFQRAVELNPADAMAHNNLAVAYEANGDFDNAAKEYKEALRLDRGNTYIQKNYSRYTEFMSRSKKRRNTAKTASTTTPAPAPVTAAVPGPPLPDASSPSSPSMPAPPAPTPAPPGGH